MVRAALRKRKTPRAIITLVMTGTPVPPDFVLLAKPFDIPHLLDFRWFNHVGIISNLHRTELLLSMCTGRHLMITPEAGGLEGLISNADGDNLFTNMLLVWRETPDSFPYLTPLSGRGSCVI